MSMEEYGPAPHLQYRSMGKREMPPLSLTICARGRAGPEVGHKSRIRWHRCERANPKGIKTGQLALSLAHCYIGWRSQGNAGALPLVVRTRRSRQADQPCNYGYELEPRIWVGSTQHPPRICSVGGHEGAHPADPKLQDLQDTRQKQGI